MITKVLNPIHIIYHKFEIFMIYLKKLKKKLDVQSVLVRSKNQEKQKFNKSLILSLCCTEKLIFSRIILA